VRCFSFGIPLTYLISHLRSYRGKHLQCVEWRRLGQPGEDTSSP